MSIKEIDQATVRFIASGEKISDIEDAIRELVENSIDACARVIEIRMARFGVDSIEVLDDGTGIQEENFKSLGVRYHTSKINNYETLQKSLETFGFRGEALSCLCHLANVSIITKAKASPTGTKLTFKMDGTLAKTEPVARSEGTTVIVRNLFHSLPVRRRELESTAKRQYDKVVKLLYEQVIARPHIKFTLCKKSAAKKEKDFTHGGTSLTGVIITIFGVKVMESLLPIKQPYDLKTATSSKDTDNSNEIQTQTQSQVTTQLAIHSFTQIESDGPVERPATDITDTSTPCNPDIIDSESTIKPKRDLFYSRNCKSKFARLKPEYSIHGYISKVGEGRNSSDCQFIYINKKPCDIPKVSKLINEIYRSHSNNQYPFYCLFIQVQPWASDFNVPRKRAVILQDDNRLCDIVRESLETMFSPYAPARQKSCPSAHIPIVLQNGSSQPDKHQRGTKRDLKKDSDDEDLSKCKKQFTSAAELINPDDVPLPISESEKLVATTVINDGSGSDFVSVSSKLSTPSITTDCDDLEANPSAPGEKSTTVGSQYFDSQNQQVQVAEDIIQDGASEPEIQHLEDLRSALIRERNQRREVVDSKEYTFAIHPKFNTVAEQELKFNLNKSSFESMQVIGQFNRGFILALLNKHIFIIDQHATDERANYEDQLEKSPFMTQPMVHPKPLYLTYIQETAIIDNLCQFEKRGFEFRIDQTKQVGMKISLKSISICKGNGIDEYLTIEDLFELIDVAVDAPNQLDSYTLRKVKSVAATRACRKSVMIGDKLNWSQMDQIVSKMATLKNPWICAHNRPTIRHLMDTDWMSD